LAEVKHGIFGLMAKVGNFQQSGIEKHFNCYQALPFADAANADFCAVNSSRNDWKYCVRIAYVFGLVKGPVCTRRIYFIPCPQKIPCYLFSPLGGIQAGNQLVAYTYFNGETIFPMAPPPPPAPCHGFLFMGYAVSRVEYASYFSCNLIVVGGMFVPPKPLWTYIWFSQSGAVTLSESWDLLKVTPRKILHHSYYSG